MTPADLATAAQAARDLQEQQLLTAWIQAGAAIAQAVGALAAIGVSIWLAQQSAKREIAADHAATARAEAAERAAADRAADAERRAEERDQQRRIAETEQAAAEARDSHNGPIDLILKWVDDAIAESKASSKRYADLAATDRGHHGFSLFSATGGKALAAIAAALPNTHDVQTSVALNQLRDAIMKGKDPTGYKQPGEVAYEYARYASAIEDVRPALAACRR